MISKKCVGVRVGFIGRSGLKLRRGPPRFRLKRENPHPFAKKPSKKKKNKIVEKCVKTLNVSETAINDGFSNFYEFLSI
jgi:hypothetical protein